MSHDRKQAKPAPLLALTVGELEGMQVELMAGAQPRLGEQLVHGHDQVPLCHVAHAVQHLLWRLNVMK